ncbi:hypothetical protein HFO98_19785 [Rhizobium leguminosarum]|uniref:hypothetical protein n=1 Tax=Rhizobium leguminosarum TaxID=384 RepID=UPI001C97E84B|nr:hypothetical protein [Rhizobium leguminosarum]MBY5410663.1 hypothetical protein [Rhizobium leguminosarum]
MNDPIWTDVFNSIAVAARFSRKAVCAHQVCCEAILICVCHFGEIRFNQFTPLSEVATTCQMRSAVFSTRKSICRNSFAEIVALLRDRDLRRAGPLAMSSPSVCQYSHNNAFGGQTPFTESDCHEVAVS